MLAVGPACHDLVSGLSYGRTDLVLILKEDSEVLFVILQSPLTLALDTCVQLLGFTVIFILFFTLAPMIFFNRRYRNL